MTSMLQKLDIFTLRPLITNLNCKLSTITEYDAKKQLLCLVSEDNEIILRYTNDGGQEVLKLISWFNRTNRVIHDVCFDPTGTWLLVLCFDNTLHVVPAQAAVDKSFADPLDAVDPHPQPFSTKQITSFIIPFVGPHECPNSKNCPNHNPHLAQSPIQEESERNAVEPQEKPDDSMATAEITNDLEQLSLKGQDETIPDNTTTSPVAEVPATMEAFSHDVPSSMLAATAPPNQSEDKTGNNQVMAASFMASKTCPYPLAVVWWRTIDGVNRAVIGYSDSSICFVALSPNCPFVASTSIESGSVVKLLICKDTTFESVMLLITSSLKQQYKLLLEQKAIKYIYPGDISPTTSKARDSDWQIVMPLKTNSNCSDPASDSSQLEEDVFLKNDEVPSTSAAAAATQKPTVISPGASIAAGTGPSSYVCTSQIPPPPPYSVAINRHLDTAPITTTAGAGATSGVRFQQSQLSDLDELNGRAGIIPAARARLASLKSLGTKKLHALKMRLSDNRQKFEEYIPENTLSSFAIVDSPSLTPELLDNTASAFYTIQNLRSTYLLSALHCHSNSLSVHSIDINLKPLFLYKIPRNCYDILISSNLLYSIQYVDIKEQANNATKLQSNTEKENRDTDVEKDKHYAEFIQTGVIDLSEDDDKLMQDVVSGGESAETSATTTGNSTNSPSNSINAVGVISSAMATLLSSQEDKFNAAAQLGMFRFEHETVLSLYQMATYRMNEPAPVDISKEERIKAFESREIRSPEDYVKFYETADVQEEYSLRQMEIMQNEFPKINYDPCYVVTNKNVYYIELRKEPFALFLDAALASEWLQCHQFCNTFDLSYEACIEFAGDYLLRRKKVTQALLTYNKACIKPIRTALKLAMFGQTYALMHLCAMALKCTYLLKSKHFCHPIIKTLLPDITYRHSEDVRKILPPTGASYKGTVVNEGASCSDYTYGIDESACNLQMSPSSQFHLANLLLITLAEKAVNDKNYMPLWNFLVTNTKYHTNMTSIVLCQSGLFSAALILAKVRGVFVDTFLALASVMGQEFGWYSELNVCLYNLSEPLFMETITYLPDAAVEYFINLQEKLEQVRPCVLKRLEQQLNPFSAILRPIVSHTSAVNVEHLKDNNSLHIFEFCKNLIETYLAVLIHMESQRSKREQIENALSTFRISYEDNQFAIETSRFKPISAGCAHCACVVDGIAYFWGSNGVPCNFYVNKSSEPPEPPHAVKSLELLSQLNLEVHAVKCGRQHTLVLTNNGLYSFGNNNLSQLGIGKHVQVALQPVLVQTLDGKNITILEAGQYHNAIVADGVLYSWGWGVFGQLGHGDTENVAVPKPVVFFKNKKIIQVSLGHAHSLVLCQEKGVANSDTELYVFGSNHFGQLGISTNSSVDGSNPAPDDEMNCTSQVKSLVPIKILVSLARIRLIHTKFFTNLAVDENERLYTWGTSPQALRLANQIKRRANAKLKIEEQQRREISKRFEATLGIKSDMTPMANELVTLAPDTIVQTENDAAEADQIPDTSVEIIELLPSVSTVCAAKDEALNCSDETDTVEVIEPTRVEEADAELSIPITEEIVRTTNAPCIKIVEDVVEEFVPQVKRMETVSLKREAPPSDESDEEQSSDTKKEDDTQQKHATTEVDPCEHMTPHLVDTSEVAGQILQVSSGLFHFALISSSCTLYTWGKNLEHQLGTGDKERRAVNKPSPIDTIESPMYVDCGADFTLVMTTEFVVRAFGGNSNGQCGRDLGPSIDKMRQRVVCMPTTKRLMRFESQCVELPVEINLPRPRITLDSEPVRYLKSIPQYQPHFVIPADINFSDPNFERPSPLHQYHSTTQEDSSENALTGQDSEDVISSLENISNNEVCSNPSPEMLLENGRINEQNSGFDDSPEEQSYARLVATDMAEPKATNGAVQKVNFKFTVEADDSQRTTSSATAVDREEDEEVEEENSVTQDLRNYIHYCLYIFHGLYNPDKVQDFAKNRLEYRIRTQMLNFKFVDAFKLCLQDCNSAHKTLKVFEYFTKDTGFVPMRKKDQKYLIYYVLHHFLAYKFNLSECEQFLLADLDYYLLELAYVLYFNNNNTVLEQNLNQKFKSLIAQEDNNQNDQEHQLEDTDVIFDSLSVKFKTIVCQRLIKYCSN